MTKHLTFRTMKAMKAADPTKIRMAEVVIVGGQVVKNRHGVLGPASEVLDRPSRRTR